MVERQRPQTYVLAGNQRFQKSISQRSLEGPFGAFFLPYLAEGHAVLDCGCGPGSITLGIARAVAPGEVVGADVDESAVEAARAGAVAAEVQNVRFEQADAYDLPFGDGTFDRVFVSSLLEHLSRPDQAVREFLRVLKPGGIAGIGAIAGAGFVHPETPEIYEVLRLSERALRFSGGDPTLGRSLRELLLEAGFAQVEYNATGISNGTNEQVRRAADALIDRSLSGPMLETMLREGWLQQDRVEAMKQAIRAWGENPHAVGVMMYGTAVAWKA